MYDVIVVGARCAGAATAMLLARRGHRVLLIDKSSFPSDLVRSTHLIWQPGVAKLDSWGLHDTLRDTGCPALTTGRFDLGPLVLTGEFPPAGDITRAYSPRRTVLDAILINAATQAGAHLWEASTVEALRTDIHGAVTGVTGHHRGGTPFTADAAIVVGADGQNSVVAQQVDATEYHTCPTLEGTYFAYWSGVPADGIEFYPRPGRAVYGWATHDDLAVIGINWAIADFPAVRADIEANYHRALTEAAPGLADRVNTGVRESKWIGAAIRGYFRTSHGPGWALVGDAGYQKDQCTAQGITDAFTHAELLATAIDDGLTGHQPMTDALAGYERTRNQTAQPMYEFTCEIGALRPPSPQQQHLYASLATDPHGTRQFLGMFAGTTPTNLVAG